MLLLKPSYWAINLTLSRKSYLTTPLLFQTRIKRKASAMTERESKGWKLKPKVTNQDHGFTKLVCDDINIDVDKDDDKTSFNRPSIHS